MYHISDNSINENRHIQRKLRIGIRSEDLEIDGKYILSKYGGKQSIRRKREELYGMYTNSTRIALLYYDILQSVEKINHLYIYEGINEDSKKFKENFTILDEAFEDLVKYADELPSVKTENRIKLKEYVRDGALEIIDKIQNSSYSERILVTLESLDLDKNLSKYYKSQYTEVLRD